MLHMLPGPGPVGRETTDLIASMTSVRSVTVRSDQGLALLVGTALTRRAHVLHGHGAPANAVAATVGRRIRRPVVISASSAEDLRGVTTLRDLALIVLADEKLIPTAIAAGAGISQICVIPPGVHLSQLHTHAGDRERVGLERELGARAADLEEQYEALLDGTGPLPVPAHRRTWPSVSIVIPTFERRDLVLRALEALSRQTYMPERMEVIVVDNGSSDGTSAAVRARTWPWSLQIKRFETNRSPAEARNAGIALACRVNSWPSPTPTAGRRERGWKRSSPDW